MKTEYLIYIRGFGVFELRFCVFEIRFGVFELRFGVFELRFVYAIIFTSEKITSSEIRSDVTFVKNCSKCRDVSFEEEKCVI
jgi:hypothetical protein